MTKTKFLMLGAVAVAALASCQKQGPSVSNNIDSANNLGAEIAVMNGVETKGYIDGTTFYEKATADLHKPGVVATPRTMMLSAFLTPQEGTPANYFVGAEFKKTGADSVWHHVPAYYWPMSSHMDFLAYSSTDAFSAKDAQWYNKDASKSVILNMTRARCQDDVVFAAAQMDSKDATLISGNGSTVPYSYQTAQPVNMEFAHSQAWIEFQLSIAQADMANKIAIKEIVVENAYDKGKLTVSRTDALASAAWDFTGVATENIVFDDTYNVYGHSKTVEEYTELNQIIAEKEQALEDARQSGNADAIATAQANLETAQANLANAVKLYPVVNALNAIGSKNERPDSTASAAAEVLTDCAYMDMLLPQQPKTAFVIRYVLAGKPDVLEYRYDLSTGSKSWEMGHKYIYDIDFVISEITVAPTVKEWQATFDGTDLKPVELL